LIENLPKPPFPDLMLLSKPTFFPDDKDKIFLAHCSVSRLLPDASEAICRFNSDQAEFGFEMFYKYGNVLTPFRNTAAELLKTGSQNLSFLTNTSEGMNMIANGYPFQNGDSIISYIHEYPSNHYPWVLQKQKGVKLELLENHTPPEFSLGAETMPGFFLVDELEKRISKNTRMICLSHVQFTSGFAADLKQIGELCRQKGIDFIVDAAQSLGSMPLYPEEYGISAVAASGWKWLMGPIGTGILYTSPEFREKIQNTMVGADLMEQGQDYLNHNWAPLADGRRFEYSTRPLSHAVGLDRAMQSILKFTLEEVFQEILRLQDLLLSQISRELYLPMQFNENRSGILSFIPVKEISYVLENAKKKNLILTERGGFIRFAPHFYNTDDEILQAADILNSI